MDNYDDFDDFETVKVQDKKIVRSEGGFSSLKGGHFAVGRTFFNKQGEVVGRLRWIEDAHGLAVPGTTSYTEVSRYQRLKKRR